MISDPILIAIQSIDPFSKDISKAMGTKLPPQSVHPYANATRKVYVRAAVSLAAGHVQEHIHARQHQLEPTEAFDEVDETINACIKQLVERPEPHLWQNCHATAMALWYVVFAHLSTNADQAVSSHILLQASHMQYLSNIFPHPHINHEAASVLSKARMALKYSRRMSWDMVRSTLKRIRDEAEMPHLPFAGLCSVFRAGLVVLETREFVNENLVNADEVRSFKQVLQWFAGRWGIGHEYLICLEELLGRPKCPRPELRNQLR
jgi:hypothetical protein